MNTRARSFHFALPLVLAVVPFATTSCVAVAAGAAGAAGYAWYKGAFEATLEGNPRQVTNATKRALGDYEMKDVVATATELDGKVTARTALDKEVVVTIQRKGEGQSTISIRVGAFGDEDLSRKLYEKIRARL